MDMVFKNTDYYRLMMFVSQETVYEFFKLPACGNTGFSV